MEESLFLSRTDLNNLPLQKLFYISSMPIIEFRTNMKIWRCNIQLGIEAHRRSFHDGMCINTSSEHAILTGCAQWKLGKLLHIDIQLLKNVQVYPALVCICLILLFLVMFFVLLHPRWQLLSSKSSGLTEDYCISHIWWIFLLLKALQSFTGFTFTTFIITLFSFIYIGHQN